MGNRTQKTDSATGTEGYTYNAANMLLTRGANTYTNDLNGNTLTGGGRTNTWDSENRLITCANGTNTSVFTYGSDGLRHRSTTNAITTDFALDGDSVVREMRAGVNYATYLSGPTGPMYRRSDGDGTIRWYVYDGLGSVVGEVDPNGVMTARRGFDVYGATRSSSGTATSKHGFVGGLGHTTEDETGLVYMRARYYDPGVGRFVSEDPSYKGLNWFMYCQDNPIGNIDESGRMSNTSGTLAYLGTIFTIIGVGCVSYAPFAALNFSAAAVVCFGLALIGEPITDSSATLFFLGALLITGGGSFNGLIGQALDWVKAGENVPYARTAVLLCFMYSLEVMGAIYASEVENGGFKEPTEFASDPGY